MAAQLKLTAKSGTVKKIASSNVKRTMDANSMWYSSSATEMSVNDTLAVSETSPDILVMTRSGDATLEFTADTLGSNGQGTSTPGGLKKVEITALSGSVYILRAGDAAMNKTKIAAYSDSAKETAAINGVLYPGDMIVCSSSGGFTLKYTPFDNTGPYIPVMGGYAYAMPF